MFTDGITEAMNESEELFGEERLLAALRSRAEKTPQEFIAIVACRWRP